MKIECSLRQLKNTVQLVGKITTKNNLNPISGMICFETQNKGLFVYTTNINLAVKSFIKCETKEEGRVVVYAAPLISFLSSISQNDDDLIKLNLSQNSLVVSGKSFKTSIKTVSEEEFPTIEKNTGQTFSCLATEFIQALKSVYTSAAQTDIKPEIASISISYQEDTLVFVATDSFRLSEKKVYIPDLYGFPTILVPQKNVTDIIKILSDAIGTLKITIEQNQMSIEGPNIYIKSHILNTAFPDYTKIIPQKTISSIKLLSQDFVDTLKSAVVFSSKEKEIVFSLDATKNILQIKSTSGEIGDYEGEVVCKSSGEGFTVSLNYSYIIDFLSVVSSDSIEILWFGEKKPLIFKQLGDTTYMYLVMPMKK